MKKELAKIADKDFVKLYRRSFSALGKLAKENGSAFCILLFLIRNMDGNNSISIKQETIAEYVKLARQTVSKQLKYLDDNGWIEKHQLGRNNVYVVNDRMAWTSYACQRSNCEFNPALKKNKMFYDDEDTWNVKRTSKVSHTRRID